MNDLKLLDNILKQLKEKTTTEPISMEHVFWYDNNLFNTDSRTRFTVMNKLCKDGYADHKLVNNITSFYITFDGLVFIERGGYTKQLQKEKQRKKLNDVLAITIAVSGIVASIYYVVELVNYKNNHNIYHHQDSKGTK